MPADETKVCGRAAAGAVGRPRKGKATSDSDTLILVRNPPCLVPKRNIAGGEQQRNVHDQTNKKNLCFALRMQMGCIGLAAPAAANR